jgi:hypothetical protein
MAFSLILRNLWLVQLALLALLLLVVIGKRLWTKLPVFAAYSAFTLVENLLGYAVLGRPVYYLVYLVGESIAVLLGLGLVYEIFTSLLSSHAALRRLATLIFSVFVAALLLLAGAVIYTRPVFDANHAKATLLVVEEAARIVEVGLIMFLVGFSAVFGLHWRQHVFGIALGLGIFTAVQLALVTLFLHAGTGKEFLILAGPASYDFSLLVWLGYLLAPERVPSAAELPKRAQLEQWNRAIMELINQ